MNGSSQDPDSLISSTPPFRLPLSKASNWIRIDIFWLPGTRDDSPDGRTPTCAMTTPSIENVALRMSSPRVSSRIDVKSSSDIHRRTSCIAPSSKNDTDACLSGALSGGAVLGSTCGGPPGPGCDVSQAASHATAPSTIANPRFSVTLIAVSSARIRLGRRLTTAKPGPTLRGRPSKAFPDAGLPAGNRASEETVANRNAQLASAQLLGTTSRRLTRSG